MPTDINKLIEKIKKFNYERDWDQYHNPKDILIALVSEVGELAECYRWLNEKEISVIHTDPGRNSRYNDKLNNSFIQSQC
jgi:NTP pyrophosphatase (non-canonical NTP hydrolase)